MRVHHTGDGSRSDLNPTQTHKGTGIGGDRIGVDAFHPDHGTNYNVDDEPTQGVMCGWLEDSGVQPRLPPKQDTLGSALPRIAFVDGTMRTDARLTRTDKQGNIHTGLAGSWAAGAVLIDGTEPARVDRVEMDRLTVITGGVPVHLPAGENGWRWNAAVVQGHERDGPRTNLLRRMRDAEAVIAETLCAEGWLTVIDGPLHSVRQASDKSVVGYVKTHHRRLLQPEDWAAVPNLGVGERTGLFAVGKDCIACYVRVAKAGPWATPWTGIVRIETPAGVGVAIAAQVVDGVTQRLPSFASPAHMDARAPVNLTPISGLERHLRRMHGDPRLALYAVRRAVMQTQGETT